MSAALLRIMLTPFYQRWHDSPTSLLLVRHQLLSNLTSAVRHSLPAPSHKVSPSNHSGRGPLAPHLKVPGYMVSRPQVVASLTPLQLGVGVKGGCEAMVHSVSSKRSSSSSPSQCWTLLLDFSNAFNNISRESMSTQIRQSVPSITAWMESCYSCQPFLCFGQDSISSCCGVQWVTLWALWVLPLPSNPW